MDFTALWEILQQGGVPAALAISTVWLFYVRKDRKFWRDEYLKLRDERDEENEQRKTEQENYITILERMLDHPKNDE